MKKVRGDERVVIRDKNDEELTCAGRHDFAVVAGDGASCQR
jgi:hypothetical protein